MKKRLFSLFLVLLLLTLCFPAAMAEAPAEETAPVEETAAAEETAAPEESAAPVFPYVLDQAGLLSDSQRETLEQKAAALSEQHQCSLYIVTVQDHTSLNYDVYEAAKGIFQHYDLGWGENRDGVILLLSMDARDYAFAGHGGRGETICSRESSWLIEDMFLDDFRNNDWYGGFEDFWTPAILSFPFLKMARTSTPAPTSSPGPTGWITTITTILTKRANPASCPACWPSSSSPSPWR